MRLCQIKHKMFECSLANTCITINVPLFLKVRAVIFFMRANHIIGLFEGFFEGAETFLTPKLSRAQRGTI